MKYLLLLSCSLVVASPAWGQSDLTCPHPDDVVVTCDPPARPPSTVPIPVNAVSADEILLIEPDYPSVITVVGTGSRQMVGQLGQSISIMREDEISRPQGADLTRVLERLPGISFARSGGLGSQTSLFVRGANSEQLLVTIDGVRVEDTAAPSGGFDLGTLMTGGIGRIEMLRGSNSLAWGSDAIGGVLALTTDTRSGARASIEGGAHGTIDANAGLGLHGYDHELALSGGYTSSDGISAFAGGTEPDPLRQWHFAGRGMYRLDTKLSIVAAGRYSDSRIDFDGFPPPLFAFADTPEYQTTRQASGRIGFSFDQAGSMETTGMAITGGVALSDTRRAYYDSHASTVPNFNTIGRSVYADLTSRIDLTDSLALNLGGDADWSRFSTTFDPHQSTSIIGAHALLGHHGTNFNLTAGARIDHHDRFGSHATFGANASYWLGGRWRLKGSWGQGFKAPTLSQLYGFGGNALLKPETSNGFDAGIEYDQRNAGRHFALTLFRRDSSNLIDYVSPTGYFNVSRTRAQGVELEAGARFQNLTLSVAYTYLEATDRTSGRDLARRPRHLATLSADWETPLKRLKLGADLRLVGDSFDDRGNFTRLDGYGLLTLRASVPLGEHLELYGRVENVTDKAYQTVAGYGTYGRSAYGGVRVKW